jgi:NADH:ubiquinone reductase (H+-translocating)
MSKKIMILGAGYAGVEAALTLQKKKKKNDDIEITLIDKNSYHTLLTEIHEIAGNRINEDGVVVPLKDIFNYTDVKVVKDEIANIDFETKRLVSLSGEYNYDYLIIGAGSEPNYYGINGLAHNSFSLWSYQDALKIREHIKEMFLKASQENDSEKKKKMLTFVVGGGGFTGVEVIGEIALWTRSLCKEYKIKIDDVKLVLVEALDKILINMKEKSIAKAMNYLEKKLKVEVLKNSAIMNVDTDNVLLKDGRTLQTKTLIWTAGVRASCITDEVIINKNKSFRISVNGFAETQYDKVYAVGDISAFIDNGNVIPAMVEGAIQTGHAAAENIIAEIRGKEKKELNPKLHGSMVSIGSFFAVTNLMGIELPRFLALIVKYLVNVHYLFGIGGFEIILKYLNHEVFEKRHRKFLIEKHYTVKKPIFWLAPLRLYFGYVWFMEGLKKILDGWLVTPMLAGLPADGTTSASVTEGGKHFFQIVSAHTPGIYAWFANTFVIPNALFFQICIVLAEVGIGLAFASGAFNFIAACVSLALILNFILSTGILEQQWWYIPASIAMMAGSGYAFGLDYYIMPYLMRQWRYFVRNKKIKICLWR